MKHITILFHRKSNTFDSMKDIYIIDYSNITSFS